MVGRWQVPDVADVRRDARGDAGDARSAGGAGSAGDAGVGSAGNADVGSAGDAGNAGGTGDAGRAARAAVVVRLATLADIDAVSVIESAAFADPWPAEAFQAQLARSVVWFAVAELHDEVVGYVVEIVVGDEAEIANIAVGSEYRGLGIGAKLLDSALHESQARGVESVYLEVRESNTAARRLYASRRFSKIGRRSGYYRNPPEDAIVLRRSLVPADLRVATDASPQDGELRGA